MSWLDHQPLQRHLTPRMASAGRIFKGTLNAARLLGIDLGRTVDVARNSPRFIRDMMFEFRKCPR